MESASPKTSAQSVYFGDVVAISAERWFVWRGPWWAPIAWIACAMACGYLGFRLHLSWAEAIFWPLAGVGVVTLGMSTVTAVRIARLRQRLIQEESRPADTYGQLALRLWRRALVDSRGRVRFDAAGWIERVGPDGPRMILLDLDLPDIPRPIAITEEVPIGVDGPIGPDERRTRWIQIALFGFNLILALTFVWSGRGFAMDRMIMAAVWTAFITFAMYRLGFRPITIGASSAIPGLIRVTRGATTREFQRADSVLVLSAAASQVSVWVFRADGAHARFNYMDGAKDPGLQQLIERWCWPRGLIGTR